MKYGHMRVPALNPTARSLLPQLDSAGRGPLKIRTATRGTWLTSIEKEPYLKKAKKKKIIQDSDIILSLLNLTTLLSVWYFFSQHPVRKEKIIGNWYLESLISLRVIFKQPKSHPHTHAVFSVSWLQFSQVPSPKESEHGCFWPRSHRQSGAEHSTLTTELSFLTSL